MVESRKACGEIICMGICANRLYYKQEHLKTIDWIRQQIINCNRRGERGQERTDPVLRHD